jgi:hypothetical protein
VKIAWEKELHVTKNYHIWQEGGQLRGREKNSEWICDFPVPPPPCWKLKLKLKIGIEVKLEYNHRDRACTSAQPTCTYNINARRISGLLVRLSIVLT